MGQLEKGIYVDDCDSLTVEEIREAYGVEGEELARPQNRTGAGNASDDDSEGGEDAEEASNQGDAWDDIDDADIEENIIEELAEEQIPPAVHVDETESPFNSPELQAAFFEALARLTQRGEETLPAGYKVLPEEWDDGEYPAFEMLKTGRKRSGELVIPLPTNIWLPRAELWARGLHLMLLDRANH